MRMKNCLYPGPGQSDFNDDEIIFIANDTNCINDDIKAASLIFLDISLIQKDGMRRIQQFEMSRFFSNSSRLLVLVGT